MAQAVSQTGEASEVLAGLVERVVFHNPESGFCVLKVEAREPGEIASSLRCSR